MQKEFLAEVGSSLWYPALSCFSCTSCPPTSSAFPQLTSSVFGARTGFGRCLCSVLHNSNSQSLMLMTSGLALCTTEIFHESFPLSLWGKRPWLGTQLCSCPQHKAAQRKKSWVKLDVASISHRAKQKPVHLSHEGLLKWQWWPEQRMALTPWWHSGSWQQIHQMEEKHKFKYFIF